MNPRKARVALAAALAAALVGAWSAPLAAQVRGSVSGMVTEMGSQRPLVGAQVFIPGTGIGAVTNGQGRYVLNNVRAGQAVVKVQMLGYSTAEKTVTVSATQVATASFELRQTAIALDEVVVTGTGVAVEKRKLGNKVASIDARSIEAAPVNTFSEILAGREAGVVALPNGGLTGEGTKIRIRGNASMTMNNDPVVYLNGVRIDNKGGRGYIGTGGGGMPSRLDDIDPSSIERIEILKGAAAATLYGSEASAGVIQIFTKKGATGDTKWDFQVEQGMIDYPDVYKAQAGFARTAAQATALSEFYGRTITPFQVFEVNNVGELFNTGRVSTYNGSVSGGTSLLTYFASGRWQDEDGPVRNDIGKANDIAKKAQGSLNIAVFPTEKLQLRVSSAYSDVESNVMLNNNNIYAPITLAMFGKPELANCTKSKVVNPGGGLDTCEFQGNPFGNAAFATTREGFQRLNAQGVQHYNGSLSTNYKPVERVNLDATFGVDMVNQRDTGLYPFGWNLDGFTTNNVSGYKITSDRNHREISLDAKASWNAKFGESLASDFVFGGQGFVTRTELAGSDGTTFPGPGFAVTGAGAVQNAFEYWEQIVNLGLFLQEQVGYNDWAFFTAGGRYDKNSAFGENTAGAFYPKASISLVASDRAGWTSTLLSTLRFRAAIGQSGRQPGAFDKLTTFSAIRAPAASGAGVQPSNLGNPDLKPEISTEWEAGAELGLFNNRAAVEVTWWDRVTNDALVFKQFPVTGGFLNRQMVNLGQLDAHGLEISAHGMAFQTGSFSIDLFGSGSYIQETVTDMGGAAEIKVGGSYPRYRNFIRQGFAPGAFFGPLLQTGLASYVDTNRDCQPDTQAQQLAFFSQPRAAGSWNVLVVECGKVDQLRQYIGKPTPDWQGSFGANIAFLEHFKVAGLFEYKFGNFFVHNLTDAFRRSNAVIGRNLKGAAEAEAKLLNPASSAADRLAAAEEWARKWTALTPYDGLNEIEKADFIRFREISLTYTAPVSLAGRIGAKSLALTATGRNVGFLKNDYAGIDPETNVYGVLGNTADVGENFGVGIDAFGLPLPKRFSFSARVGF